MRTAIGWVVGIAAWVGITMSLEWAMRRLGIPTYIDFGDTITVTHGGGRYSYDTEESGASTMVGTAIQFAGLILAVWAGRWVALYPRRTLFDHNTHALMLAALAFLSIYGVLGAAIGTVADGLYDAASFLNLPHILDLAAAGLAFWLARKVYLRAVSRPEAPPERGM